jgi:CRISPR/Cas system endoribonuclease Cas6 (RAMP superfamily)
MSFTNNNNNNIESFIPRKIKEFYRPITRNVRQKYENFYGKTSTKILNVCKKIGIL